MTLIAILDNDAVMQIKQFITYLNYDSKEVWSVNLCSIKMVLLITHGNNLCFFVCEVFALMKGSKEVVKITKRWLT